MKESSY